MIGWSANIRHDWHLQAIGLPSQSNSDHNLLPLEYLWIKRQWIGLSTYYTKLRHKLVTSGISLVWTQLIGLPTYCRLVTSKENPNRPTTKTFFTYFIKLLYEDVTSGISLVWTQSIGLPTYCRVVTSKENPNRPITKTKCKKRFVKYLHNTFLSILSCPYFFIIRGTFK